MVRVRSILNSREMGWYRWIGGPLYFLIGGIFFRVDNLSGKALSE